MTRKMVFLESHVKKKTIQNFLGDDFLILATQGHLRSLKNEGAYNLGVDLNNFSPQFETFAFRKRSITYWKKILQEEKFEEIYLATDPDREGEAIAKEIIEELSLNENDCKRLLFYEITPTAIKNSLLETTTLNKGLVESQLARQVLDKMIGFCISPLLHKQVNALSAGRVQSVALKIIVEREEEIKAYEKKDPVFFIEGVTENPKIILREINFSTKETIYYKDKDKIDKKISALIKKVNFFEKTELEKKFFPNSPLTTSSLLFEAKKKLGFSLTETTKIAQKLYEGVELKDFKKRVGLITYPRTDSKRINDIFTAKAYRLIKEKWGKEYFNFFPIWKNKKTKHAQEAHESIHPTFLENNPEKMRSSLEEKEFLLYKLIYEHSLVCLMTAASVKIVDYFYNDSENILWTVREKICLFPGFLAFNPQEQFLSHRVLEKSVLTEIKQLTIKNFRVALFVGDKPFQFDEGSLVSELERLGIGRPSTYSSFVPTLLKRKYVFFNSLKRLVPSLLGYKVNEWLQKNFVELINKEYTAQLEIKLDEIENQKNSYLNFISQFWSVFSKQIKKIESTAQ